MPTMFSPICEVRVSDMLADDGESVGHAGSLDAGVHLPGEWFSSLIRFLRDALPGWRDDPARETATGETKLTAQLCARLASLTRHTPGWDFLQFRREEPDETSGNRAIDLAVAPCGDVIWIEGRAYTEYQTLLPVECKRLPTPPGSDRDEREYLISRFSSAGGIQRFKAGHHGAAHNRAAMIGYLQAEDCAFWRTQLDSWINGIVAEPVEGWSESDKITLHDHDAGARLAALQSNHVRKPGLAPILIDHLWIEM
jgi:hypothetical protein